MRDFVISKEEAKKYLLYKHGLFGAYQYHGKQGILDFINKTGCIQFDPVDVVGRNADLTLQARIKNYDKKHLYELLYHDRLLIDGHDKMMSIYHINDWHYLQSLRSGYIDSNKYLELLPLAQEVLSFIETQEYVSSIELEDDEHIKWGYGSAKKSRAILDLLFYQGKIIVHHKERSRRFYVASSRYVDADKKVFENEEQQLDWHILRRISAVGLLWNRNSDALLGIANLNAKSRAASFMRLLATNQIQKINIEGINTDFYIKTDDLVTLNNSKNCLDTARIEFLAPLDPLLWDRKLIALLFDFDYKWEIYTPKEKRIYGHYVLPIIHRCDFIGRVEFAKEADYLIVKQLWSEDKKLVQQSEFVQSVIEFAQFNSLVYKK